MAYAIDLPIKGFDLFPCFCNQQWIIGLEGFDIAKSFGNIYYSDMFISLIMLGVQPFY
jgi:hypothetical protein